MEYVEWMFGAQIQVVQGHILQAASLGTLAIIVVKEY